MSNLTDLISEAVGASAPADESGGDNADAELLENLDLNDETESIEENDDDVAELDADPDPAEQDTEDDVDDEADDGDAEDGPDEGLYTVTVDGEEVQVNLDELTKGYMRQAKFTRSQQQLADERREVESLREEVAEFVTAVTDNPIEFVTEVSTGAPDQVVADFAANQQDPTEFALKLIATLHSRNVLLPELSQLFIDAGVDLNRIAVLTETERRSTQKERQAQREAEEKAQREAERAQNQAQEAAVARFEREWEALKEDLDLGFEDQSAEEAAIAEIVEYCVSRGITDLSMAWTKVNERKNRQAEKLAARKAAKTQRAAAQQPASGRSSAGRLPAPEEDNTIFKKPNDKDPLRSAIYAAIKDPTG
jgi:hypothetical protein